jgi:hypothetical protein
MVDLITSPLTNALDSIGTAVESATDAVSDAVNTELANINTQSLGTATITMGFMTVEDVEQPVGPGVTISIPSYTGSILVLDDPLHFQGTIDFTRPSGAPNDAPSYVGLVGIPADSWSYANNTLTLFSGGQVTDTVKIVNDPVGFGVFRAMGGTVIGSGATPVAPDLVPLPTHM